MSKELFIAAHEKLIEEYMGLNPDASWSEAYEKTADMVDAAYGEMFADMVDAAKQRAKDEGNWPPRSKS